MGHRVTTLNVNTIEPAGNTLTIGASGDSVVLADDVKSNTYKDAGGNTLFTSDGSGVLSSVNSGFGDALKLLSTSTFTNQATVSFTSGIDSTYKLYIFKLIDIGPATDSVHFQFQVNASGQTGYNETMTTTAFRTYHVENGSATAFGYSASYDQAQGTAYNIIAGSVSNDADNAVAGTLHLFNPASTTYAKHFYGTASYFTYSSGNPLAYRLDSAGYINTTSALSEIDFKMSSGNFDGTIKMYGVL
jgi:hypothetical protein